MITVHCKGERGLGGWGGGGGEGGQVKCGFHVGLGRWHVGIRHEDI